MQDECYSVAIPQWNFMAVDPDDTERNPVSEEFFINDTRLESIIRESIQNSLDARYDVSKPVEVRIYFPGINDPLPAEKFKRYWNGGEARFNDPKNGLISPTPQIDDDCLFFVVEDFNTTGLTGRIDEKPREETIERINDWNYFNYFRRENGSTKFGANTLGNWGAGKCVFERASRLKTSFIYSVREGYEPRQFLVGKATHRCYQDKDYVTWAPDGWFGLMLKKDPRFPNRICKRPIVDEVYIQQFKDDFNIKRNDEPGTSIVIPHIYVALEDEIQNAKFNQENLIQAVLRNFLIAIHNNDLVVKLQVGKGGEEVTISKDTFSEFNAFLPTPNMKDVCVTTLHHKLILEALNNSFPASQKFTLNQEITTLDWCKEKFLNGQLQQILQLLNQKKTCFITVPMPIFEKGATNKSKPSHWAQFHVILKQENLPKALGPVFFRAGLLIDSVSAVKTNSYLSAVIVENDELAKLLAASEPPSHNQWAFNAERVIKGYEVPRSHIQYVTTSVRKILDYVMSSEQKASWAPLSDVFGIPKPKQNVTVGTGASNKDEGGEEPDTPPNLSKRASYLSFSEINGKEKGIRVSSCEDFLRIEDKKFPMCIKFKIAYETFNGQEWSPHDFNLSDSKTSIKLNVVSGNASISGKENLVILEILDKTPFVATITGIDPNRDMSVDKIKYSYTETSETEDEDVAEI